MKPGVVPGPRRSKAAGPLATGGMRLVLASRSPRRVDLLSRAGYRFDVEPADIDESRFAGETPRELVLRLARGKAAAVAPRHPGAIVLGADTLVVVDGVVLGKPDDDADAARMLRRLSGRAHEVLTGVALRAGRRGCDGVQSTRVVFRALSRDDVAWYVAAGESADKAGGYSIQGRASRFVTRIEGSYTNVVGLPIELVDGLLDELGAAQRGGTARCAEGREGVGGGGGARPTGREEAGTLATGGRGGGADGAAAGPPPPGPDR